MVGCVDGGREIWIAGVFKCHSYSLKLSFKFEIRENIESG